MGRLSTCTVTIKCYRETETFVNKIAIPTEKNINVADLGLVTMSKTYSQPGEKVLL